MTVVTPESLAAAYEYFRTTPPFREWNLPDAEDIKFVVTRTKRDFADHAYRRGKHKISVSRGTNGWTMSLMISVAHEMIHVFQAENKLPQNHGEAFAKLAEEVCRIHGFDPKVF